MNKKLKKFAVVFLITITSATLITIVFSPYRKHDSRNYRTVEYSIDIDAPTDSVFAYLGNSKNAEDWSMYVDHIVALNSAQRPEGTVGAKRRCFHASNEEGIIWDEEVVEVIPSTKRRLTIYNMKGFSVQANGLETEQLYEALGPNKTRLTFTVFYGNHNPSLIESLKMYYASYEMHRIFKGNLMRVKRLIEQK